MNQHPLEYCLACGEPTEKAGPGDGSLYCNCGSGPFCQECYDNHICDEKDADDVDERTEPWDGDIFSIDLG